MATTYTPVSQSIQTGATQYNVQPNTSLSRAFQATEQALLGGMKLQEQIKEEQFRKDQIDLQNTMSAFNEDYAAASWAQKQVMASELEDLVVTPYNEDNRWSRALNSAGVDFKSRVMQNLEAEREQRARAAAAAAKAEEDRQRRYNSDMAYIDLQTQMQDASTTAERTAILAQWKTDNVDVYEGVDDASYVTNLSRYTTARGAIIEERRQIADQQTGDSMLLGMQAQIIAEGGLSQEYMDTIYEQATTLSTYDENPGAIRASVATTAASLLHNYYSGPDFAPTQENVDLIRAQAADLVAVDPRFMESAGYKQLISDAATLQSTVNATRVNNLDAMLVDGGISQAVFNQNAEQLVQDGLLTREVADARIYQKQDNVEKLGMREIIAPLIMDGNIEGLQAVVESGDVSRSMVTQTVGDLLTTQAANLARVVDENGNRSHSDAQINAFILSEYAKYRDLGLAPSKLDVIEQNLGLSSQGITMTPEQTQTFLQTYELAREAGYPLLNNTINEDYSFLKTAIDLGIPDVAERLNDSRVNRASVRPSDIEDALNRAIQNGDYSIWVEELTPRNQQLLRSTLRPVIKRLMEGGIDAGQATTLVNDGMDTAFMRVDPAWGGGNTVWIPRTEEIYTPEQYKNVYNVLDSAAESGISYVMPLDGYNAEGMWVAGEEDGTTYMFTYDDIVFMSRQRRMPNQQ